MGVISRFLGALVLLIVVLTSGQAQQPDSQSAYTISTKTVKKDSYARKILSKIALGNNIDTKTVNINLQLDLVHRIQQLRNNQFELLLNFELNALDGNTKYRDFATDSLLFPDNYQVNIIVSKESYYLYNQNVSIGSQGLKVIFEADNITNVDQLRLQYEIVSLDYSRTRFDNFTSLTTAINSYYGYGLLLDKLNKRAKERSYKSTGDASDVFLHWHELERVNSQLDDLDFYDYLHLDTFDPELLFKKRKELARHLRRSTTLLNQTLNAELKKGFISDKQNYILGILNLSVYYYNESKKLQPYLASAFSQTIAINATSMELETIERISNYYDAFAYGDQKSVPLSLNDLYLESAIVYLNKSRNNMALQQLKNAKLIQESFRLMKTKLYTSTLALTLNGMIESCLYVWDVAFNSQNFIMAETYYQNAERVFNENVDLFKETNISVTPFTIYLDTQTIVARQLLKEKKYPQAVMLLENCEKIHIEKNLQMDVEVIKLLKEARQGVYEAKLKKAKRELSINTDSTARQLYGIKTYVVENNDISTDEDFDELSYSVFLEYLQTAEILLDKGKHDEAISYLLKAKNIEDKLLDFKVDRLDELLKKSSVPVILELIEEASLHTWAKRSKEAADILNQAREIQIYYRQQDNEKLNQAFDELETKMKSRHCIDIEFQLKENHKILPLLLFEGKFEKANLIRINSDKLLENNIDCNLDSSVLDSLSLEYGFIFSFYKDYELMRAKLFQKGYVEAIELYLKLRHDYIENNIEAYNFNLPSLYEFIEAQNQTQLCRASVEYFIEQKQYQLSFEYLQLLKQLGVPSEDVKDLQLKIGSGLRLNFDNADESAEMAQEMTLSENWFKYFIREMKRK